MTRRATYSMAALFLLVTIVGALLAVAFSGLAARRVPLEGVIAGAPFGGFLGLIVMIYQTRKWNATLLVSSWFVGAGVGLVAAGCLAGSNEWGVALAGGTIVLAYSAVIFYAPVRAPAEAHGDWLDPPEALPPADGALPPNGSDRE